MSTFFNALIPVMFLIILGFFLKKINLLGNEGWKGIEKVTYYILFPSLLISTLSNKNIEGIPWKKMLIIVVFTLVSAGLLIIILNKFLFKFPNPTMTSVFQGGVRFNTYIAISITQALSSNQGVLYCSVVIGFTVVTVNLLCISVFIIYGSSKMKNISSFLKELFYNPLIIACIIGWFLSISGMGLPGLSKNIFEIMGKAALPLGLLAVGAALKPEIINGHFKAISISSIIQYALKPIIIFISTSLLILDSLSITVLFIVFMTPTSPASYILAGQLGGDTETMASIITFQTLAAFVFMPIIASIFL